MFSRLFNVIRGFFAKFISGLEASNPEALIENEKENLRESIGKYNETLAAQAGFVEKLGRQIRQLENKQATLSAKIKATHNAGNDKVAGQLALQYKEAAAQLAQIKPQYETADKQFKSLSKQRDLAVTQAQKKIRNLENMVGETKMHEAQAEIQEMSKGMITSFSSSGGNLDRIESMLQDKRDKAAGRARVAAGNPVLGEDDLIMGQEQMDALGSDALGEFLAMEAPAPAAALPQNTAADTEEAVDVIQHGSGVDSEVQL